MCSVAAPAILLDAEIVQQELAALCRMTCLSNPPHLPHPSAAPAARAAASSRPAKQSLPPLGATAARTVRSRNRNTLMFSGTRVQSASMVEKDTLARIAVALGDAVTGETNGIVMNLT